MKLASNILTPFTRVRKSTATAAGQRRWPDKPIVCREEEADGAFFGAVAFSELT
jgi:hypothetical protein